MIFLQEPLIPLQELKSKTELEKKETQDNQGTERRMGPLKQPGLHTRAEQSDITDPDQSDLNFDSELKVKATRAEKQFKISQSKVNNNITTIQTKVQNNYKMSQR